MAIQMRSYAPLRLIACLSLILPALFVSSAQTPAKKPAPIQLALELSDGSRIIGLPEAGTIPFATQYGKMDIALKLVDSSSFSNDHETVTVLFQNGDKLEGALSAKEIKLTTLFGKHAIPVKHVASIDILADGSLDASFRKGLVLHYSFDRDENDKVTDKSGKGNHGEVNGAKWTAKGKVGGAYEFDGIDDYIEVAHSKHLDFDAASDSFTVAEGAFADETSLVASLTLLDGDSDTDLPNDTLTVNTTPVVGAAHGALVLYADGTFDYTHNGSENFSDSFTYQLDDAGGNSDITNGLVTITIFQLTLQSMETEKRSFFLLSKIQTQRVIC